MQDRREGMTLKWIENVSGDAFALIVHLAWPLLAGAIIVSMAIAVFQAATQVQEQTLSFVPKILITFYLLYERGPYIGKKIQYFLLQRLDEVIWLATSYKH